MSDESRSLDEILARFESKPKPERVQPKPRPKTRWAEPNYNRSPKRWERCKRGHLLTEDNVIIKKRGQRRCKTCQIVYLKRYAARQYLNRAVDPRGLRAAGASNYLTSDAAVAKYPSAWDDPYAQVEDLYESEEVVRLVKQGRLGASRLGAGRSKPFGIPMLRLERAIDHQIEKGIPPSIQQWAEAKMREENETRRGINRSSQAGRQAERSAGTDQIERASAGGGPAARERVRAIGRIQRTLVTARRVGQIRFVASVDTTALRGQIDELSDAINEYDLRIQEVNWQTDLL